MHVAKQPVTAKGYIMSKQTAANNVPAYVAKSPREGSLCAMVRDIFEATEGITSAMLPGIAESTGMHPTTVRLQFYRWRAQGASRAARAARSN